MGKRTLIPNTTRNWWNWLTQAKTINGYMIQVKGYASATGSAALNQKLSEDRANNVASILLQKGRVPLTNMLAPGAMGESRQIGGDEKTADTEAAEPPRSRSRAAEQGDRRNK